MKDKFYLEFYPHWADISEVPIIIEPNNVDNYVGDIILMRRGDSDNGESDLIQGFYDMWIDDNGKLILNQE